MPSVGDKGRPGLCILIDAGGVLLSVVLDETVPDEPYSL
jgi:hypothetical protein